MIQSIGEEWTQDSLLEATRDPRELAAAGSDMVSENESAGKSPGRSVRGRWLDAKGGMR